MNPPNRRPTLSRRSFAGGAAVAACTLAVPSLWAQARPERSRITLAVGGKATFYYLPLTIAEQLGHFKAEGLDVEIVDHPGDAQALQAVAGGQAMVCSGAFEQTIYLHARKQDFRALVLQGRAPQIVFAVSNQSLPHYRTVADLKGKRIGVSSPGSSTNLLARLVLARGGTRPGEVEFVGVGAAASALTALRTGQIDAICNTDPIITMLEQKGEVRIISDTRTLKGTAQAFGGPMPAACLYAQADFIQKNPNTCQALANAIVHSLKWLQTAGPGDVLKTVPESYLLGDRALYLAAFNNVRESISPDGLIADEAARTALAAMAGYDPAIQAGEISAARLYTNSFARKAKDRFQA